MTCLMDLLHFYMKFGMVDGRDVQTDIRRNHITRNEGIKLVNKFDGEFPKKYFKWFLDYTMISEEFLGSNGLLQKYISCLG